MIGETRNYSFEAITKAIRLIGDGSRFIVTNPDATGHSADGPLPATGAVAAALDRRFVLVDANPDAVTVMRARLPATTEFSPS